MEVERKTTLPPKFTSFSDYLNRLRDYCTSVLKSEVINVVIGNESCDIDSCVCSLVYAYFLTIKNSEVYLPLLHTTQEEICFKLDLHELLVRNEIKPDSLLYLPSVRKTLYTHRKNMRIVLVDHNDSDEPFIYSSLRNVIQIVDHRKDLRRFDYCKDRIIDPKVMSCCTLISQIIDETDDTFFETEKLCTRLLLTGIFVDSYIVLEKDKKYSSILRKKLKDEASEIDELGEQLKYIHCFGGKEELSDLCRLRRDCKEYWKHRFLICETWKRITDPAVLTKFVYLRNKNIEDLSRYTPKCEKNDVLFVLVKGFRGENYVGFFRELIIFLPRESKLEERDVMLMMLSLNFPDFMKGLYGGNLVRKKEIEESSQVFFFETHKDFSRKKVEGILMDHFSQQTESL